MTSIRTTSADAREKISEAIVQAEGRARARTITADQILETLDRIDNRLDIAATNMIGITVKCDLHAHKVASTYRGTAYSTWFAATYRRSGWYITDIYRDHTYLSDHKTCILDLPEKAQKALAAKYKYMQ